jgi:membrane associated rhomboid family serine protease
VTLVVIATGAAAWLTGVLHGGLLQLLACLAALAIFGQGVEDAMGRASYVLLMLISAAAALAAQLAAGPRSGATTLACAGAVAAVLGAYLVLRPTARVHSVLFAPLFSTVLAVPAALLIGVWLVLQIALGLGLDEPLASIGGAWFAHLAAIVVGVLAARPLARRRPLTPAARAA